MDMHGNHVKRASWSGSFLFGLRQVKARFAEACSLLACSVGRHGRSGARKVVAGWG